MMNLRSRQRGISVFGLMLVAVVLGIFGLIGLKLFPVYTESFKIDAAAKGIVSDPAVGSQSISAIRGSLIKRLDIDDVRAVGEANFKEHVKIIKRKKQVFIEIDYRTETPLFANLAVVATFSKRFESSP